MASKRSPGRPAAERGFTLIDMIAVMAILATLAGIAVPLINNAVEGQRLGIEVRNVERELQLARLAAVSYNQPIRVRFNCPAAGQYRRVELIGTVTTPASADADSMAATRCSTTAYPYPAADRDPLTRPNNDGPLQQLHSGVSFQTVQPLEFWPNGTVHVSSGGSGAWPIMGTTPVTLRLLKGTGTMSITVNSLGKIQIQ